MKKVRVFDYVSELDCFVIHTAYKSIANLLGLAEWNEVVWIGRYFSLDNDFGEHWFDNFDEQEKLKHKAKKLKLHHEKLFIINSSRFQNGRDGPCHNDEERKRFWTDVLTHLMLSIDTLSDEARKKKEKRKNLGREDYIPDLEKRIEHIKNFSPKF